MNRQAFSSNLKRWIAKRAKRIGRFVEYWSSEADFDMDVQVAQVRKLGVKIGHDAALWNVSFDPIYPELITIGNRVTITNAMILTHDDSAVICLGQRRAAPVNIGDDVFIGWNSLLLPGVCVGSNCNIGAGSVVTHDIPSNIIAAGVPARVIGTMPEHSERLKADPSLLGIPLSSNRISNSEHICMKRIVLEKYF